MTLKKSGRGSIGRSFKRSKRLQEDKEFREKRTEMRRIYRINNKEKIRKRYKKWEGELDKFKNKRCKICNKLLYHKNKSGYCKKHVWVGKRKK